MFVLLFSEMRFGRRLSQGSSSEDVSEHLMLGLTLTPPLLLRFPFVDLNQGRFEAGTVSYRCLWHSASSVSGASRRYRNESNKLFEWQICEPELRVPGTDHLCQRCGDTRCHQSCHCL